MKEKNRRGLASLILILLSATILTSTTVAYSQDDGPSDPASLKARAILSRLSPEEKVGQLFLITIDGQEVNDGSPIVDLVSNYHIGGVVLKSANNNFSNQPDSLKIVQSLINSLQTIENDSSNNFIGSSGDSSIKDFIPLFIGISQPGDSYPHDQYFNALTPIPSQMAIGATWDTSLAEEAGKLTGKELSALGFNMIFNPSLDVLETPYGEGKGDLGVQTFGGDPYWVGEMGKAYIRGIHEGSNGKMAVIVKNFPGRGSSDRLPEEDVATVRKSLEQLKLFELAPFFEVAGKEDDESVADGLLLSHIRYQGFQGNIRATTKPVSFDQTAVDLLMNLPELKPWRENQGLLVSEDLGSDAIRKFFNPGSQATDARLIARNAFLSGNDLLYMDQLISSGDTDRFETYRKTIDQFIQKYQEDRVFADRVDASVLRLLRLKFKLYPEFSIESILADERGLENIGRNTETPFRIVSKAATLISPKIEMLETALPNEPSRSDRMIIFTDVLTGLQCTDCTSRDIIAVNEFQNILLRLYGISGSSQINNQNLVSYSFADLADYVSNPFNRPELETNLSRANWAIFFVHDQNPDRESANALHYLLSEKPESLRDKNVIVFSLNAPYYFDATEISSFTAYFGIYTKIPTAFDIAARLLFKEMQPQGSPPVSISGIAYNLLSATAPAASQIIELSVDQTSLQTTGDESETELPVFRLGDNLPIKTGVILDQNGHQVPDGTVVRFMLNQEGEYLTVQQLEATTLAGIARASFKLTIPGRHEIRASSEPALNSQILLIDISEESGAIISAITPTALPPISTPDLNDEEEIPVNQQQEETLTQGKNLIIWLLSTLFSWGFGYLFFWKARINAPIKKRTQTALWIVIGGSIAGIWQIIELPGKINRFDFLGILLLLLVVLIAGVISGTVSWQILTKTEAQSGLKDQSKKETDRS